MHRHLLESRLKTTVRKSHSSVGTCVFQDRVDVLMEGAEKKNTTKSHRSCGCHPSRKIKTNSGWVGEVQCRDEVEKDELETASIRSKWRSVRCGAASRNPCRPSKSGTKSKQLAIENDKSPK